MASITNFLQKTSKIELIGCVLGVIASLGGVVLWLILNFANPYSGEGATEATIKITFMWLGLPAICGLVASVLKIKRLMYTTFLVSLPFSTYLAATPSIFKLFIVVSMCYMVSAVLMSMGKKRKVRQVED